MFSSQTPKSDIHGPIILLHTCRMCEAEFELKEQFNPSLMKENTSFTNC